MPEFDSRQFTDSLDFSKQVNANTWGGRVRASWFQTPAVYDAAQNDTIRLAKLPDRARVIGGRITHGAFGTAVTFSIGDRASGTRYLNALAVAAAGESNFADTVARNMGFEVNGVASPSQTLLIGTWGGGNPNADIQITGYVLYMVD